MNYGPSPNTRYPIPEQTRLVYLKTIIQNPNIIVGDYTYYDDVDHPENFERNVLYHFDLIGDQLIIGKFCSIASDVKFIMNGGNHRTDWFTNYPFPVFGNGWESAMPDSWPFKGNTVVGNDVWIGRGCLICDGSYIEDGVVVAANSVVKGRLLKNGIYGGSPVRLIKFRFVEYDK